MSTTQPPQPPPAPSPPSRQRVDPAEVRPGRFWYWIAGGVAVLGIVIGVALLAGLVGDVDALTGELTRLDTPGEARVKLDAGSERTIYQQTRGVSGPIATPPGASVGCRVSRLPGGEPAVVTDTGGFTLSRGRERYHSVLKFEADGAGVYRVRCIDNADPGRHIPLAIGRTVGLLGFVGRIFATLVAFFGGIIIAAGIATVVAIMRANHRRKLARESAQPG